MLETEIAGAATLSEQKAHQTAGFTIWTLTLSIPMKIFGLFWMSVIRNARAACLRSMNGTVDLSGARARLRI